MMKRIGMFAATAVAVLGAGAGQALAAGGQNVCVGGPGTSLVTPNSKGSCGSGHVLKTLALESEVTTLQGQVAALQSQVAALQTTLSKVSYHSSGLNGKPTLEISGANLQIDNGTGQTGNPNGLGNVFIGYDDQDGGETQTGSHNLILGELQTFTSFGSILGGFANTDSVSSAAVFGRNNTANGSGTNTFVAGSSNYASADSASVSGGTFNTAEGGSSSVSGGIENVAVGDYASVVAGTYNVANAYATAVLGGEGNHATGDCQSIPTSPIVTRC
jgi:hypothetical protein